MPDLDKTKQAKEVFGLIFKDYASKAEVARAMEAAAKVIKDTKQSLSDSVSTSISGLKTWVSSQVSVLYDRLTGIQSEMRSGLKEGKDYADRVASSLKESITRDIKRVEDSIPEIPEVDLSPLKREIEAVASSIPTPETGDEVIAKINKAKTLIAKEAVKDLEKVEQEVEKLKEIRLTANRGIFGAKGFQLLVGGVKRQFNAQTLNLVAGSNVTLTYNYANGRNDITISATGGSGAFSLLAATGAVNDTNTAFTFPSEPTMVVVNGASYRDGHGCSITGTSVTLDSPVGTGGDIYGIG